MSSLWSVVLLCRFALVAPAGSTMCVPIDDAPVRAAAAGPVLSVPVVAEDRWFGEDKLKHFFMSLAVTNLAYGAVRTAGLRDGPGLIVAGGGAAAVGVWKEWRDRRAGGPFSHRDLVWDGLGVALGLVLAASTR